MNTSIAKPDQKAKLTRTIEQAKAKLQAINARESATRRKQETRGAIVFSGYAFKLNPSLLDRAITEFEGRVLSNREKLDLEALKAFRSRSPG